MAKALRNAFNVNVALMNEKFGQTGWICRFSREKGVTFLAFYTSPMCNHVKIIVAYCGPKDTFKKKIGFNTCVTKMYDNEGILMKVPSRCYAIGDNLQAFTGDLETEFLC